ncbi:MAG: gamma-glutamyltransferase [Phormidesmis sp.]
MAGVVSAGHEKTAEAGAIIFELGGNAFDAAVAASLMACVVEPTLTSLGGGGFLLAHEAKGAAGRENTLFDFFTQTPSRRHRQGAKEQQPDFYPIKADFGDSIQEFHIGLASMAVPGVWAGLLAVHKKLGRLPLKVVVEPAVSCARSGLTVSEFQGYCYELLHPILLATAAARTIYAPNGTLLKSGERLCMPEFANTLEYLASLGDEAAVRAFYEGEIAQAIVRDSQAGGGFLSLEDFRQYAVIERSPLSINYRGVQMLTNPPPSSGGALIAFCLELLDRFDLSQMTFGSVEHLTLLSQAMRWTNQARRSHLDDALFEPNVAQQFITADLIDKYARPLQALMNQGTNRWGSTTHISVIDDEGNAASITTSNGEGSSYVIPGTQIMMNNMLGEEDLNPNGFHQWPLNQRLSSMMAPTLILQDGKPQLALGSGGSNRIRTAILQVISNIVDFGLPLAAAVEAPRIHWESGTFHLEPGLPTNQNEGAPFEAACLVTDSGTHSGTDSVLHWQQSNMFFGGVHTVGLDSAGVLQGAGDPRRSGSVAKVG